jgi:NAD+ kinase
MYVSSYARARQTAAELDVVRSSWIIDTRLAERDWGELDRMTEEERALKFREVIDMQKVEPFFWTPPNGESFNDLILRIRDFIDSLHRAKVQNVLALCHGDVMKAFRIIFQGLTPEEYAEMEFSKDPIKRIHNCQIDHYTRRDPDLKSAELASRFEWLHVYRPASGGPVSAWVKLPRRRFTSHELAQQANKLSGSLSDIDI